MTLIIWNSTNETPISRAEQIKMLGYFVEAAATAFGGWYLWRKYEKEVKPDVMIQFQRLFEAELSKMEVEK